MPTSRAKKKPAAKKKIAKKSPKKKMIRTRSKKQDIKNSGPEVMFDSKIGKTDALFVSAPEDTALPAVPLDLPAGDSTDSTNIPAEVQIDPVIDAALREFDDLQKTELEKDVQAPRNFAPEMPSVESLAAPENEKPQEKSKQSFWKRIFPFKK